MHVVKNKNIFLFKKGEKGEVAPCLVPLPAFMEISRITALKEL